MAASYRSRQNTQGVTVSGILTHLAYGEVIDTSVYFSEFVGVESKLSEGHPFHNRFLRKRGYDLGGIFSHQRREYFSNPATVTARGGIVASEYKYDGSIHANTRNRVYTALNLPARTPTNVLEGYGASMYNRAKPTRAQMGMGQFLGELREIPTLPKLNVLKNVARAFATGNIQNISGKALAKYGANGYLNYEFGWKPFVKDLVDFLKQTNHIDKTLRQLSRDNGKWVRRNMKMLDESDMSIRYINSQVGSPTLPSTLYLQTGRLAITTRTYHKIWFTGAFKYYIPTGNSPTEVEQRKRQLLRIVYGAEVSPKLAWQLLKQSWLADWVANIGDNISNLSDNAADSLVARYAYAMDNVVTEDEYCLQNVKIKGTGLIAPTARDISETKGRARASPYGFAMNPNTFSARQVAILSALGINRVR